MKLRRSESRLTDLPNIGRKVARLLAAAGIRSPDELKRLPAAFPGVPLHVDRDAPVYKIHGDLSLGSL